MSRLSEVAGALRARSRLIEAVNALPSVAKGEPTDLLVKKLRPNDWNPNVLPAAHMEKLKAGIQELLDAGLRPPPVVVRKHPSGIGWQIIDGFHRWSVFKELGIKRIPAHVLNVDDKMAKVLTTTLNYLRGQPDEAKYADLIGSLIKDGSDISDLAKLLPEGEGRLMDLLEESEAGLDALRLLEDQSRELLKDEKDEKLTDESAWVDLNFRVSVAQAKVIESEIGRIETSLKGKARRGRALEFMAVNSQGQPLPDEQTPTKKKKSKKEADRG